MRTMPDRSSASPWRRTASEVVFACPWLSVRRDRVRLPGGESIAYHVVQRGPWAMVVPVRADGRVVMERVWRWPTGRWTLECPSGGLDGDAPEAGARRELEEETGYRAGEMLHLGHFAASNGYSNERYDVYLALDVTPDGVLQREATEEIEIELHDLDDLRRRILAGELEDGPSSLAILLAWEKLRGRA